jgi:hypothetical protein
MVAHTCNPNYMSVVGMKIMFGGHRGQKLETLFEKQTKKKQKSWLKC